MTIGSRQGWMNHLVLAGRRTDMTDMTDDVAGVNSKGGLLVA